jgi:hypothetical protein
MAIVHRYIDELSTLEDEHIFCGMPLTKHYKYLIIGTFNPNDESCTKLNTALWFYGRPQNKFWRYLPNTISGESLHQSDSLNDLPTTWQNYCIEHSIIIIDLIKKVNIDAILDDFGDKSIEALINSELTNVESFDIAKAFGGIKFDKVIYSLAWKDARIRKMKLIRDRINDALISNNCISSFDQIKYPNSPARNDEKTKNDWYISITN